MHKMKENNKELIDNLFKAGSHYAMTKRIRHPSTLSYIYGLKSSNEIFDLEKTAPKIEEAIQFMNSLGSSSKKVLFVGSKNEAQEIVERYAKDLQMPYSISRWIGGMLTNFDVIKNRIKEMIDLEKERDSGAWEGALTKKEKVLKNRHLDKLNKKFDGIRSMEIKPDALLIVDSRKEKFAVEEAKSIGVPVIAIVSSDCDISQIDYPVIGNSTTQKSIDFLLSLLTDSYKSGKDTK